MFPKPLGDFSPGVLDIVGVKGQPPTDDFCAVAEAQEDVPGGDDGQWDRAI